MLHYYYGGKTMLYEFSRTELLIGKKNLDRLAASKVAVFGIGGVGSFAVEALVRAGVGKLVLVDDDCVCITNINRQLHATSKTVGRPKVDVMKERAQEINPRVEVTAYKRFYEEESSEELINSDYDYIIDAIDTVSSKIDLIVKAKRLNIPIISCMGAGNKVDASGFKIADIYKTSVCPLAKVMRRELKKREIESLKVLYSNAQPVRPAETEISGNSEGFVCMSTTGKGTRKRQIPGSISFVPSVAGLLIAGEAIRDLIGADE
jgi:tRNA threonylcarbamoyladenosine dehydratase